MTSRLAAAALSAVLVLAGCRTRKARHEIAIDLLAGLPTRSEPTMPAPPPPREWSFSGSLPPPWRIGSASAIDVTGAGVLLSIGDEPAFLECEIDIDPRRYARLQIDADSPAGGARAEVYFATELPARFAHEASARGDYIGGQATIWLPHPDVTDGSIRSLRLYPGGCEGAVRISRIRLAPRHVNFPKRGLLARETIQLGHEYRRYAAISGAGSFQVSAKLPAGAPELSFATGALVGDGPARFRVLVKGREGPEREVASGTVEAPCDRWREWRSPLSALAGRDVTIRFEVDANDRGIRLIGSPVLLTAEEEARPSVFLVVADTLRADRLSCLGAASPLTPHLDRLSRQGALFENAMATASWTIPSTSSILSGLYPMTMHDRYGWSGSLARLPDTLAERFRDASYRTAAFVANPLICPQDGYDRGFSLIYSAPSASLPIDGDRLNRIAAAWLAEHRYERIFGYFHFMDPHNPYDAPLPGRQSHKPFRPYVFPEGSIGPLLEGAREPRYVQRMREAYDQDVAYLDQEIGVLRAHIGSGLDDAVLCLTADHGEELSDHGFWSHGVTLYEESIHVPLLLRLPGRERRATLSRVPASIVDVMATLLARAGLPPQPSGDGVDLMAPPDPSRLLYAETAAFGPPRVAVISDRFKYVRFNRREWARNDAAWTGPESRFLREHGPSEEELYDILQDPAERTSLCDALPSVAKAMRRVTRPGRRAAELTSEEDRAERLRALGYLHE